MAEITYTEVNGYLIPDLAVPQTDSAGRQIRTDAEEISQTAADRAYTAAL